VVEKLRMGSPKYTILVVDDEELIRNLIVTVLSKLGHQCVTAMDGSDALAKLRENKFDAVITDIRMPQMDGIMLTREISKQYPGVPVMVMTAYDEEYSMGTAISVGAREFIRKPFSLNEFVIRLHKMISDSRTLKPSKSEENEHEYMEEFLNELETQEGTGNEKNVSEDMADLMKELEEVLKKK
jgi:CheY-like chemotaxis protein